jgi:hypothetical protein
MPRSDVAQAFSLCLDPPLQKNEFNENYARECDEVVFLFPSAKFHSRHPSSLSTYKTLRPLLEVSVCLSVPSYI